MWLLVIPISTQISVTKKVGQVTFHIFQHSCSILRLHLFMYFSGHGCWPCYCLFWPSRSTYVPNNSLFAAPFLEQLTIINIGNIFPILLVQFLAAGWKLFGIFYLFMENVNFVITKYFSKIFKKEKNSIKKFTLIFWYPGPWGLGQVFLGSAGLGIGILHHHHPQHTVGPIASKICDTVLLNTLHVNFYQCRYLVLENYDTIILGIGDWSRDFQDI